MRDRVTSILFCSPPGRSKQRRQQQQQQQQQQSSHHTANDKTARPSRRRRAHRATNRTFIEYSSNIQQPFFVAHRTQVLDRLPVVGAVDLSAPRLGCVASCASVFVTHARSVGDVACVYIVGSRGKGKNEMGYRLSPPPGLSTLARCAKIIKISKALKVGSGGSSTSTSPDGRQLRLTYHHPELGIVFDRRARARARSRSLAHAHARSLDRCSS